LHHARCDLDNTNGLTIQLEAKYARHRMGGKLRGVVTATALVRHMASDRREHDNIGMTTLARTLAEERQERGGDSLYRHHIDIEHARPVFRGALLHGSNTKRPTRIVYER